MREDMNQFTDEELFAPISHSDAESEKIAAPRYSYWKSVFRVFFRKKVNIIALALLLFVILFAYIYPSVTHYDPYANLLDSNAKHLSPSDAMSYFGPQLKWILGAGASGESTFDAVWNGSRISISLAFMCAAINMTIGVMLGAVWGFSKKVDMVMMEVYTIIGNVPMILIISVLSMLFSPTFWTMVFALTIVGWLSIAGADHPGSGVQPGLPLPGQLHFQDRHQEHSALYDLCHRDAAGHRAAQLHLL